MLGNVELMHPVYSATLRPLQKRYTWFVDKRTYGRRNIVDSLVRRISLTLFATLSAFTAANQSVCHISQNSSTLTITSFAHNPGSTSSEWVFRILERKSVFHSKRSHYTNFTRSDPLTEEEMLSRVDNMRNAMQLPPYALLPLCSIEMLGFMKLDDISKPFRLQGTSEKYLVEIFLKLAVASILPPDRINTDEPICTSELGLLLSTGTAPNLKFLLQSCSDVNENVRSQGIV